MANILLVEDDPVLGPRLAKNLELCGFDVVLARDGKSGLDSGANGAYDLILLDLMLPLIDGIHVLRKLRSRGVPSPVIILTALGSDTEKLEGFRAGCDDYVTKPFSFPVLVERIRAVLRRSGYIGERRKVSGGGVELDPGNRLATAKGDPLNLLPREFDLLYALIAKSNRVLTRSCLLDEVWGEHSDVSSRTVDSHITNIRKKLEACGVADQIETVYKAGYRWKG